MQEWRLPSDPSEQIQLALIVVAGVLGIVYSIKHLLSGFLPPARAKIPKPGKLVKIVSAHLQSFVAALPRPGGDVLAKACQPISEGSVPWYEHGSVNAMLPLWKSDAGYFVALRSRSKRHKERTEFVRLGEGPHDYDRRAFTEQGFLADTMVDVMGTLDWSDGMTASERARRASDALGFRYFDDTVRWYRKWRATDWDKPLPEEDEDYGDLTPQEREREVRDVFIAGIDEREADAGNRQ